MDAGRRSAPDPEDARTAAEFVARLHALKDWSGLTYRELAQRASAVGDVLPRSTVANMLSRSTLPREELVVSFVRACGCGPDGIDSWMRVRKELARRERQSTEVPEYGAGGAAAGGAVAVGEPTAVDNGVERLTDVQGTDGERETAPRSESGTGAASDTAADPSDLVTDTGAPGAPVAPGDDASGAVDSGAPADGPSPARTERSRPSRRTVLLLASAVVVLGAVFATLVHMMRDSDDTPGPPQGGAVQHSFSMGPALLTPTPGKVFIRPVDSNWCLGERGDDTGRIFQVDCGSKILPDFRIEVGPSGFWLVESYHPVRGERCTGTAGRRPAYGSAFVNQECGRRGEGEEFRFEPVTTAGQGVFAIRPVYPGGCMTLEAAPDEISTLLALRPCREGRTGQRFVLERRS
ncbi:helix-turn-helix transcriptional regulator [Streptomyces sp. NPDC048057]|uniref:helix-turn-helix transcriptional regulator n=1 Tax=Streptomyces sp. NPDC048057 TaxID=3155628 RepID=UPI0033D4B499